MISIDSYLLFLSASLLLVLAPGPDMIYLMSRTIAQGKRAGLLAALGVNLGGYFHLFAAIIGISAVIATSTIAFMVIKYAGALYLIYLGVKAIFFHKDTFQNINTEKVSLSSGRAIFWQGFISDVLNPKVAIFFLALLPQFVDLDAGNEVAQLLILGVTVNFVAILINSLFIIFASTMTEKLRKNSKVSQWLHRMMGSIFILLGLRLANEKI